MKRLATTARRGILALVLALPLVACDQNEETAESRNAEEETVQVQAFTPRIDEAAGIPEGRMPVEGERMILVPATTLFPGTARIDPQIQNPYAGDADAVAAGERHFAAFNCAGCHAPLGGGGMGPPLSDEEWIYGSEPAQVFLTIMHGRPQGMPAWGSMLPSRTVWELVAYIDTLDEIEDPTAEKGFPKRGKPDEGENEPGARAGQ